MSKFFVDRPAAADAAGRETKGGIKKRPNRQSSKGGGQLEKDRLGLMGNKTGVTQGPSEYDRRARLKRGVELLVKPAIENKGASREIATGVNMIRLWAKERSPRDGKRE